MPIIVPDYSQGYETGLQSMISQMANSMAEADEEAEEAAEAGVLLSAAQKRRILRDMSPHMVKQIGYYACLDQFNRNIIRSASRAIPGPKKTNLLVGLELLNALTENDDWTLEFVLAASEDDERGAWDRVVAASVNLLDGRLDALTQRYSRLFSHLPANMLKPDIYLADRKRLSSVVDALAIVSRLKATFSSGPCEICQKEASTRCSRCKQVFFCGKPHQTQAWKDHKLVCKVSPAAQPPTDAETASLVPLGSAKVPGNMAEAKACALALLNQQRNLVQRLIGHTRSHGMVMYLHQLHLGNMTLPSEATVE